MTKDKIIIKGKSMNIDEKIKELEERQAEIHKQNRITYQQLKDIALRLNKGQEMDWSDEYQPKYYLCNAYHENDKIRTFANYIQQTLGAVYCLDKNFLNVAIQEIGGERLKQLLEWGI